MNTVSIIIVNWNTGKLLAKCLQSLVDLPVGERELISEVIVVDNASADRSVAMAKVVVGKSINNPSVRFLQETVNHGFARANNIAIERLRERGDLPHVLLLNPDTEVKPGAVPALLSVLRQNAKAGIVGPRLSNPDGSLQESVRPFPTFKVFMLYMLKLGRLVTFDDVDYKKEQTVDQVMGAAFLIRNTLLESMVGLDEGFWVWFEEVDFCQQAAANGWQVIYTPTGEVIHHGGVSFNQLIGFKRSVPWLRSMLHYASKHFSPFELGVLYALAPLSLVLSVPASLLHLRR